MNDEGHPGASPRMPLVFSVLDRGGRRYTRVESMSSDHHMRRASGKSSRFGGGPAPDPTSPGRRHATAAPDDRLAARAVYSCHFRVLSDRLLADARIKPAAKLVLMALQKWGYGKDHCFASIETIAEDAGLGESTVRRSLVDLEKFGLIRVEDDGTNRTGRRIVRLWMANPELHPVRAEDRPLGCQNETQGTLGVKMTPPLGCQIDTQENPSERTL
jgi:hypothetical protein